MKKIITTILCFISFGLWAEVSVISVTDEDKHTQKEDFYHTFEYYIISGKDNSKCQATRIAPHWFATAAHCVKDLCQKSCRLRMDLLDTDLSVLAETTHTSKKPTVFVHPGYVPSELVKNDFALIRLDLNRAPKTYYMRTTDKNAPNIVVSKKQFTDWLAKNRVANRQYRRVLSPQLPPIVVFDPGNYVLDRRISVISIFHGKREIIPDPHPVYYVKELGYAYTTNFGIRKGMSGSGLMTNTGELIGIISAYIGADLYKGDKKLEHQEFFIFPVFNEDIIAFMRETMGSDFDKVDQKDAYPYLVNKTRKDFSPVVTMLKKKRKSLSTTK